MKVKNNNNKPFYKKANFYVFIVLIVAFLAIAIACTVMIGLQWSLYREAIGKVNELSTTNVKSIILSDGTQLGYFNGATFISDFSNYTSNGPIEDADLEIWVYLTTPFNNLKDVHGHNLTFLASIPSKFGINSNGDMAAATTQIINNYNIALSHNIAYYASSCIAWILAFIFVVCILFLVINYVKAKKHAKAMKKLPNLGVKEYFEAETQVDHKYIEKSINSEIVR